MPSSRDLGGEPTTLLKQHSPQLHSPCVLSTAKCSPQSFSKELLFMTDKDYYKKQKQIP